MTDVDHRHDTGEEHRPPPARPRRRWLYAGVGILLAGLVAAVLAPMATRGQPPSTATGVSISSPTPGFPDINAQTANLLSLATYPHTSKAAPDFHLTDQHGQPVSLSQFRGKAVVLSFNDDRCTDVCTLMAEDVVRADQYLGPVEAKKVVFLAVNVNPYFPQVGTVRQWTDSNGLANVANWHFTTGPVATLRAIWKKYGVYVQGGPNNFIHSAAIDLIGPDGAIRGVAGFGQTAVDVAPYSHGLAQAAVDLLPPSERTPVAGPQAQKPVGTGAGLGQHAPSFSLASLSDPAKKLSLAGLAGHPVVLNFWASTCQDCRAELKAFATVAKEDPKIRFVGVDVADVSPSSAAAVARAAGISYPILADTNGHVAATYKVSGLPTTVYIDGTGHVAVVHPGAMTAEQLRYTLSQFFPRDTPQGS